MIATTFGTVMIVVAAVAGVLIMIGLVLLAADRPYFKHPHPDSMPGKVRGGVHLGDPRSQGPPEGERADAQPEPVSDREPAGAGPRRHG